MQKNHDAVVEKINSEWGSYSSVKSGAVALFSTGDFASSFVRLLNLRDADPERLANAGLSDSNRKTLMALLGWHMAFSALGLIVTLALLALGNVRRDRVETSPQLVRKSCKRFGLTDNEAIGWLCKLLNTISMLCAFAVSVMMTATSSYPGILVHG